MSLYEKIQQCRGQLLPNSSTNSMNIQFQSQWVSGQNFSRMLLKFIWKNKWLRRAKEILKNKKNERGLDLLDIKIPSDQNNVLLAQDKWINSPEKNCRERHNLDISKMTFQGSKKGKGYSVNSLGQLVKHLEKEKIHPHVTIRLKMSTRKNNILSLGMDLF